MKIKGLIPYGLHHTFAGARRGKSMWAAFGAAALVAGLAAKYRPPKKEKLVGKKLKEGKEVHIVFRRGGPLD